jgi:hypothetical protein
MFSLRIKKILFILASVFLLAGCQQIYQNFQGSIEKVEKLAEESKWKEASKELKQMQSTYEEKQQWRDIYVEPEDYTLLVEQIGLLEGAIKAEDKKQAQTQISVIKALIKDFYYQE